MKKPDALTRKLVNRTLSNQARPVGHRLPPLNRQGDHKEPNDRINCRECQHFFVTWQSSAPYGCRAHGFKSLQLPSIVVFSTSGQHCLLFRRRVPSA